MYKGHTLLFHLCKGTENACTPSQALHTGLDEIRHIIKEIEATAPSSHALERMHLLSSARLAAYALWYYHRALESVAPVTQSPSFSTLLTPLLTAPLGAFDTSWLLTQYTLLKSSDPAFTQLELIQQLRHMAVSPEVMALHDSTIATLSRQHQTMLLLYFLGDYQGYCEIAASFQTEPNCHYLSHLFFDPHMIEQIIRNDQPALRAAFVTHGKIQLTNIVATQGIAALWLSDIHTAETCLRTINQQLPENVSPSLKDYVLLIRDGIKDYRMNGDKHRGQRIKRIRDLEKSIRNKLESTNIETWSTPIRKLMVRYLVAHQNMDNINPADFEDFLCDILVKKFKSMIKNLLPVQQQGFKELEQYEFFSVLINAVRYFVQLAGIESDEANQKIFAKAALETISIIRLPRQSLKVAKTHTLSSPEEILVLITESHEQLLETYDIPKIAQAWLALAIEAARAAFWMGWTSTALEAAESLNILLRGQNLQISQLISQCNTRLNTEAPTPSTYAQLLDILSEEKIDPPTHKKKHKHKKKSRNKPAVKQSSSTQHTVTTEEKSIKTEPANPPQPITRSILQQALNEIPDTTFSRAYLVGSSVLYFLRNQNLPRSTDIDITVFYLGGHEEELKSHLASREFKKSPSAPKESRIFQKFVRCDEKDVIRKIDIYCNPVTSIDNPEQFLETDSPTRGFTISQIYLSREFQTHDPGKWGLHDLENKQLRMCEGVLASRYFEDDPVSILRALKYMAEGFDSDKQEISDAIFAWEKKPGQDMGHLDAKFLGIINNDDSEMIDMKNQFHTLLRSYRLYKKMFDIHAVSLENRTFTR